jgi:circadian clock protein KaiC
MSTGIDGLDRLLRGGLRRGGLHVVIGGPGMGKSVLAHQIGVNVIRSGGKVLYLTALIETHQTLIAQARTFSFFEPSMVPSSFYYASLYPVLGDGGLRNVREEISRLVAHHNPDLLIVDGVHALKAAAEARLDYQRFMHEMEAQAAVGGLTTLLLAHPPEGAIASDPTFTIADAIFHMVTRRFRMRDIRLFSVGKLRGVNHIGGWHTFRITGDGIHIYPRVESLVHGRETSLTASSDVGASTAEVIPTGVKGLDEMLGGGLDRDSISIVVGTPGSGKTLLGMTFVTAGAEEGEPGLFIGYHERPETILQKADSIGMPMRQGVQDGLIHLVWRHPAEMLADEEIERMISLIRKHRIKRVAIDALEDLRHSVIPANREVSVLGALADQLRQNGATAIILQDLRRIVGLNFDMPMAELSALMDNALHLRYVEQKGEMKRLLAILKVRARPHDHSLREFIINAKGLSVGKAYTNSEMVLTGLGLSR